MASHRNWIEPKKRQDNVELEEIVCEEIAQAVEDLIIGMLVTVKTRDEKGKAGTPKPWTGAKTFRLNVGFIKGKATRLTIEPSKI